jgi:hypothetical protein
VSTHLLGYGLGRGVAELGSGFPPVADRPAIEEIINLASDAFGVGPLLNDLVAQNGSSPWATANAPLAFPFVLPYAATVYQLGWVNGSAAGDNLDIGIYDSSWTRLVSAGSTLCSGNLTLQLVDVADTSLSANTLYYFVMVKDTTTANRIYRTTGTTTGLLALAGAMTSATASLPLPNPLVGMVANTDHIIFPSMMMALRSTPI